MEEKNKEVEINLLELARKLWDNKKFIIKATLIGAVVGVIIAFSIPKEYTSTVVFTVNSNDTKAGNMGALASLAGININGLQSIDIFQPELYPNIMSSTSFRQELLKFRVKDNSQDIDMTLYDYLKEGQSVAWWNYMLQMPGLVMGLFDTNIEDAKNHANNKFFISKEEMKIIESLDDLYSIKNDKKTGIITLSVETQSQVISACLADTITSYLQKYIIDARTRKAKIDLDNTEKLYAQSRQDYYNSQQNLASFVDANHNITSAKYKTNQEKLQNEASLAYSIYTQMAQQVQMNKLKVQDNTPVFTIIQPAIEPILPSSMSKRNLLLIIVFLTFMSGCAWVLRKDLWQLVGFK